MDPYDHMDHIPYDRIHDHMEYTRDHMNTHGIHTEYTRSINHMEYARSYEYTRVICHTHYEMFTTSEHLNAYH